MSDPWTNPARLWQPINELVGHTLTTIIIHQGKSRALFYRADGSIIHVHPTRPCQINFSRCRKSIEFREAHGDFTALIGQPLAIAEFSTDISAHDMPVYKVIRANTYFRFSIGPVPQTRLWFTTYVEDKYPKQIPLCWDCPRTNGITVSVEREAK